MIPKSKGVLQLNGIFRLFFMFCNINDLIQFAGNISESLNNVTSYNALLRQKSIFAHRISAKCRSILVKPRQGCREMRSLTEPVLDALFLQIHSCRVGARIVESYHFNRMAVARPVLLDYNNTINGLLDFALHGAKDESSTQAFSLPVYSTVRHPRLFSPETGNRNQSSRSLCTGPTRFDSNAGMPVAPWRIRRIDSATDPTTKELPTHARQTLAAILIIPELRPTGKPSPPTWQYRVAILAIFWLMWGC